MSVSNSAFGIGGGLVQTFGDIIIGSGTTNPSGTVPYLFYNTSNNSLYLNFIGGGTDYLYITSDGQNVLYMENYQIFSQVALNMNNNNISSVNTISSQPGNTHTWGQYAAFATSTATINNSSAIQQLGSYWNGSSSIYYGIQTQFIQNSTTPSGQLNWYLNNNGTLTSIMSLNQFGDITANAIALNYVTGSGSQITFSVNDFSSTVGIWNASGLTMSGSTILTTTGVKTNAGASTAVSVGASPYTYTNSSASNQQVFIQGGTVTAISFNPNGVSGISLSGLTDNILTMRPNDTLTITYTAAPTITTIQL
jgi:hypothetical protein